MFYFLYFVGGRSKSSFYLVFYSKTTLTFSKKSWVCFLLAMTCYEKKFYNNIFLYNMHIYYYLLIKK